MSDQALSSCVLQHAGGSPAPCAAGQARWGRRLSAHHSSKLRMRSHTIRAMFSASLYVGSSTEYLCACPAPGSAPAMRALLSTLAPPVAGARHGWEAVSPSDAAVATSPALSAARAARVAALRRVISARLRARTTGPLPRLRKQFCLQQLPPAGVMPMAPRRPPAGPATPSSAADATLRLQTLVRSPRGSGEQRGLWWGAGALAER